MITDNNIRVLDSREVYSKELKLNIPQSIQVVILGNKMYCFMYITYFLPNANTKLVLLQSNMLYLNNNQLELKLS